MTEQVGQYIENQVPTGLINFSLGQPAPQLLPLAKIAEAASRLATADRLLLQYGVTSGFLDFRKSLTQFLCEGHGTEFHAEQLVASSGICSSMRRDSIKPSTRSLSCVVLIW